MENLLGSALGSSDEPPMYRERRGRRRQPVQREALEDTREKYATSTVVQAPRTPGDFLPQPSRDWHRLILDDGEWDFRFQ